MHPGRTRRDFLKAVGLGGAALAWPAAAAAADDRSDDKPNILFILADDVGLDAVGCYGGESIATPNLDKLAASGMRFQHVYSAPVCHPSRVMLMTGRYPFAVGSPGWGRFPREAEKQTFAHQLKRAGYATAVAGKWQLTMLGRDTDHPHRLGFDEYCLFGWHEGPRYHRPHIRQNGTLRDDVADRYGPDVYCDFLSDFMKRSGQQGRPFCAFYSMALCHDVSDDLKTPPPYAPGRDRYESFPEMAAQMDRVIGRLLEALDKLGLSKRTLVLFTTDNGTPGASIVRHDSGRYVRERFRLRRNGKESTGGKGTLTDRGTRAPTMARWPGHVKPGSVCDELIDFTDILPTFGELAGAPKPPFEINGHSFAGLLTGGEYTPREWVYADRKDKCWVRTQRWKLYNDGRLYDMSADSDERKALKPDQLTAEAAAAKEKLARALAELRPGSKPAGKGG